MSTPFPLEEAAQTNRTQPTWDPWQGKPSPSAFAGMGFNEDTAYLGPFYRTLEAAGSGVAKGAAVLNGAYHGAIAPLADWADENKLPGAEGIRFAEQEAAANTQQARDAVKSMTPDPATTGTATQMLHSVVEGGYLLSTGALVGGPIAAAGLVGGAEGGTRYQDLREQGVDAGTAAASGAATGVTSAAGAFMPAAYGSSLATRLLTGAVSNTAFGVGNRYADHKILEMGGYPEMAAQQKVWDGTQMLIDAALGTAFGAIHHVGADAHAVEKLKSPDTQDAALTANVAMRNRSSGPGVAIDPASQAAHQAALEKATEDLMQGRPVDVSDTGVDQAQFLSRPAQDVQVPHDILIDALHDSGILDEQKNLEDLEASLAGRLSGEKPALPVSEPVADSQPSSSRSWGAEKTEAKRNTKTPDASSDSALEYLSKSGGINFKAAESEGFDPADMKAHRIGIRHTFNKNGMSLEDAAEKLGEAGYDTHSLGGAFDKNKVIDIIDDELRGKKHFSNSRIEQEGEFDPNREMAEAQFNARMEEHPDFAQQPEPARDFTTLTNEARRHGSEDEVDAALEADNDIEAERRLNEIINRGAGSESQADVVRGLGENARAGEGKSEVVGQPPKDEAHLPGQKDLLGDDTRSAQALADEIRRRDKARNSGQDSVETGRPDDLFSQSRQQTDITDALGERPRLAIPDESGQPVSAEKAVREADAAAATAAKEIPAATEAAVNCFGRKGS